MESWSALHWSQKWIVAYHTCILVIASGIALAVKTHLASCSSMSHLVISESPTASVITHLASCSRGHSFPLSLLSLPHITERENVWRYPYLGVNCSPHPSICGVPGAWASSTLDWKKEESRLSAWPVPAARPVGFSERWRGVLVTRGRERTLNGEFSQTARGSGRSGGSRQKRGGKQRLSQPPYARRQEQRRPTESQEYQRLTDFLVLKILKKGLQDNHSWPS